MLINIFQIRFTIKHIKKIFLNVHKFVHVNFQNFKKLTLILNCSIKWNNFYAMLIRFQTLKIVINWWIEQIFFEYYFFRLKKNEWNQIKYLIQLFESIKNITNFVFKFKIATIHTIWKIYEFLFDHLKKQKKTAKKINYEFWIENFRLTIETNHKKLRKYNDKIAIFYELYLNFVIILNSKIKLNLYEINDYFFNARSHVRD